MGTPKERGGRREFQSPLSPPMYKNKCLFTRRCPRRHCRRCLSFLIFLNWKWSFQTISHCLVFVWFLGRSRSWGYWKDSSQCFDWSLCDAGITTTKQFWIQFTLCILIFSYSQISHVPGSTPIYKVYRYVPLWRVRFLNSLMIIIIIDLYSAFSTRFKGAVYKN